MATGRFVHHTVEPNTSLIARGAAADIWLLTRDHPEAQRSESADEQPIAPPIKYVSKCVRLTSESLLYYRRGQSSQYTREVIWETFVQDYTNQVERWRSVENNNVIKINDFIESEGLNRQEEYCEFGTAKDRRWPEGLSTSTLIINAIRGLRHLHQLEPPIFHGNLNADKIYINAKSEVKLGGFSLTLLAHAFATVAPALSLSGYCRWMSPELFANENELIRTRASDIWALGCTMYEIVSGKIPYADCIHDVEVVKRIKSGEQPGVSDDLAGQELSYLWPIIVECWDPEPEKRPVANIVLSKILNRRRMQRQE